MERIHNLELCTSCCKNWMEREDFFAHCFLDFNWGGGRVYSSTVRWKMTPNFSTRNNRNKPCQPENWVSPTAALGIRRPVDVLAGHQKKGSNHWAPKNGLRKMYILSLSVFQITISLPEKNWWFAGISTYKIIYIYILICIFKNPLFPYCVLIKMFKSSLHGRCSTRLKWHLLLPHCKRIPRTWGWLLLTMVRYAVCMYIYTHCIQLSVVHLQDIMIWYCRKTNRGMNKWSSTKSPRAGCLHHEKSLKRC